MDKREIVFVVVVCLLFSLIGYIGGYASGLNWSFDKAIWLLDHQGIKIEFDKEMIATGLLQYENHIGGCMFVDNINKTK